MAKLSSYYTLCPLIDQQSLLGVEKDSIPGCVIVTLGKNIVIRYKLQDLKQLSSWSSKDRLTTPVIYDEIENRYAAVFNENCIRVWNGDESDLDEVKKYKFSNPLHTVLTINGYPPILVGRNGSTASLSWALKNRKSCFSNGVLKKGEKIKDSQLVNIHEKMYLCLLTLIEDKHDYIVIPLEDETYVEVVENIKRIKIHRRSENLVGHVVTQDNNDAHLLTLWSHGRLYSYPLIGRSANPPPGTLLSVITVLSTKHPVIMTPLNDITIAAYGADVLEEGAVLVIYNLPFKVAHATQKLKLYTKDAKLWRVENKLLLAANRHLAIAPYTLTPQRIESMLGSLKHLQNNTDKRKGDDNEIVVVQEMEVANWGYNAKKTSKFVETIPQKIEKSISTFLKDGLPETEIIGTLIPGLIESGDISNIIWCLNNFKDIPEKLLLELLSFCLTTPDETFDSMQNGFTDISPVIRPAGRVILLNHILRVHYSDVRLLTHLKTGLNFNQILLLVNFLTDMLESTDKNSKEPHPGMLEPSIEQLLDWSSLLLDSHYQQYLLSQDSQASQLLKQLSSVLETHFQLVNDLESLRPLVERLQAAKPLAPTSKNTSKFYYIEEVKLF